MTFGPEGAYGHPDHIAISQFTTAAVGAGGAAAHRVAKLYYIAWTRRKWDAYQAALKKLTSKVDGVERQATPWPDWAVTTVIDTRPVLADRLARRFLPREPDVHLPETGTTCPRNRHRALWGTQEFYRAFSLVNGGRRVESDLFEGLRGESGDDETAPWSGSGSGHAALELPPDSVP